MKKPLITIAPPTPITTADRLGTVIHHIDRAIEHYQSARIANTPLWSELNAARTAAQAALSKLVNS